MHMLLRKSKDQKTENTRKFYISRHCCLLYVGDLIDSEKPLIAIGFDRDKLKSVIPYIHAVIIPIGLSDDLALSKDYLEKLSLDVYCSDMLDDCPGFFKKVSQINTEEFNPLKIIEQGSELLVFHKNESLYSSLEYGEHNGYLFEKRKELKMFLSSRGFLDPKEVYKTPGFTQWQSSLLFHSSSRFLLVDPKDSHYLKLLTLGIDLYSLPYYLFINEPDRDFISTLCSEETQSSRCHLYFSPGISVPKSLKSLKSLKKPSINIIQMKKNTPFPMDSLDCLIEGRSFCFQFKDKKQNIPFYISNDTKRFIKQDACVVADTVSRQFIFKDGHSEITKNIQQGIPYRRPPSNEPDLDSIVNKYLISPMNSVKDFVISDERKLLRDFQKAVTHHNKTGKGFSCQSGISFKKSLARHYKKMALKETRFLLWNMEAIISLILKKAEDLTKDSILTKSLNVLQKINNKPLEAGFLFPLCSDLIQESGTFSIYYIPLFSQLKSKEMDQIGLMLHRMQSGEASASIKMEQNLSFLLSIGKIFSIGSARNTEKVSLRIKKYQDKVNSISSGTEYREPGNAIKKLVKSENEKKVLLDKAKEETVLKTQEEKGKDSGSKIRRSLKRLIFALLLILLLLTGTLLAVRFININRNQNKEVVPDNGREAESVNNVQNSDNVKENEDLSLENGDQDAIDNEQESLNNTLDTDEKNNQIVDENNSNGSNETQEKDSVPEKMELEDIQSIDHSKPEDYPEYFTSAYIKWADVYITILDILNVTNLIAVQNGYNDFSNNYPDRKTPSLIYSGDVFFLPDGTEYTVQHGDNIWTLSQDYLIREVVTLHSKVEDIEWVLKNDSNPDKEKLSGTLESIQNKNHCAELEKKIKKLRIEYDL